MLFKIYLLNQEHGLSVWEPDAPASALILSARAASVSTISPLLSDLFLFCSQMFLFIKSPTNRTPDEMMMKEVAPPRGWSSEIVAKKKGSYECERWGLSESITASEGVINRCCSQTDRQHSWIKILGKEIHWKTPNRAISKKVKKTNYLDGFIHDSFHILSPTFLLVQ